MRIEAIKEALASYSNAVDAVIATQEGDDPHAAALAVQGVERAQEVWKTWAQPEYIAPLIERLEAAEKIAAHIAAIAHEGGVVKLNEHGAMVYIRRLSLPYWISSGDNAQQEKRVGDAIGSAMAGGLAEGVNDVR